MVSAVLKGYKRCSGLGQGVENLKLGSWLPSLRLIPAGPELGGPFSRSMGQDTTHERINGN